jgi:heme-degrading monooxygenase HmoA
MICRVWHGWTTPANADAYEALLRGEVFRLIAERAIAGYRGIELLRRVEGEEVAFVTLMWFESLDAVRVFAGDEYEESVVPAAARRLLTRYDARAAHYDVRVPGAEAANGVSRPRV